jgi:hypothetical protein
MEKIYYNVEMAKAIRKIKKPVKGLVMDIRGLPQFLAVAVYEENIMEYNDSQREAIMTYLLLVKDVIESFGVRCEIVGLKYNEKAGERKF